MYSVRNLKTVKRTKRSVFITFHKDEVVPTSDMQQDRIPPPGVGILVLAKSSPLIVQSAKTLDEHVTMSPWEKHTHTHTILMPGITAYNIKKRTLWILNVEYKSTARSCSRTARKHPTHLRTKGITISALVYQYLLGGIYLMEWRRQITVATKMHVVWKWPRKPICGTKLFTITQVCVWVVGCEHVRREWEFLSTITINHSQAWQFTSKTTYNI